MGLQPADWAYAAAFVDGEGCIAITRSSYVGPRYPEGRFYYSTAVVIANRDRAVLDWFASNWMGWVVAPFRTSGNASPYWHWRSPTGGSSEAFLRGIQAFLKIKGPQCENALAMVDLLKLSRRTLGRRKLPPELLALQEERYWLQR